MDTITIEDTLIYIPEGTTWIPINWDECYMKDDKGKWVHGLDQEDVDNYPDYNHLSLKHWLEYYTEVKDDKYVYNGKQTYPIYLLSQYRCTSSDSDGVVGLAGLLDHDSDSDSD